MLRAEAVAAGTGGLFDVFMPPCPPKAAHTQSLARESTILDGSLSMVDAVSAAIRLSWRSSDRSVDPVLQRVIQVVSDSSADVVDFRRGARSLLRSLKRILMPLRVDLQELVPEFLKPIVGHVDFAVLEVLIRASVLKKHFSNSRMSRCRKTTRGARKWAAHILTNAFDACSFDACAGRYARPHAPVEAQAASRAAASRP